VVNTMGELMRFYAAANVAVIGGSFAEIGGHNPIEPAALGLPILMGPHIFNFEAICQQMMASGGLEVVADESALQGRLLNLLQRPIEAEAMGQKVLQDVASGKGAVQRVVSHLHPLIEQR
ncbi:MAG: 3-deoxy-D-manno-octulosonic acid transferase, partial [Oleiphilaceae bacterium]|nr:3-deoxy-D-manno-octulosonic acid transferase [Oleiphilaceae bacterium]